ncbi:MAG: flagellar basal body protein [Campylobacterota bacterium]|nr:flagellar basal body protein [Campylobacterota bacterium]
MISSNVSSLQANQTLMNTNANNIANSNTDGFVPNRTVISENQNGSVSAQTSQTTDNGSTKSQTDLNKELSDQVIIENVNDANVAAIKTQDQMFGALLDIKV